MTEDGIVRTDAAPGDPSGGDPHRVNPDGRSSPAAGLLSGALPVAPMTRRAVILLRTLVGALLRFRSDLGFEKAASLAYSSLLALIPTALLALSVVELLAADEQQAFQDTALDHLLPRDEALRANVATLVDDARRQFQGATGSGTVRIVSLLMMLYFSASVLTTVDRVVAHVWGGGGFGAFVRRLSAYWAVITLGPVLLALSFAATAFAEDLLGGAVGGLLRGLFPFAVSSVAIYLFYRLMPHTKVRSRAALAAAVTAGVLWEASKIGLGWWFARPQASFLTKLSFFPMALLWMYVSWAIVIYGLEVAWVVHHGSWRAGVRGSGASVRGAEREVLALATAVEIARRHDAGRPADRDELAATLSVGDDDLARALDDLSEAGLVARAPGGGYMPARGADGIRATEILRAVRGAPGGPAVASGADAARVAEAFVRTAESRSETDDTTLGALARRSRGTS